jgi:trehalose-6-phosphate synthase
MASDLVGFHVYEYARHFIASCTRILGVNASPSSIEYQGRTIKVGAYPVGIEPEKFFEVILKN